MGGFLSSHPPGSGIVPRGVAAPDPRDATPAARDALAVSSDRALASSVPRTPFALSRLASRPARLPRQRPMPISTTTRAAFAAIALLASAVPASAEWKFCAPDGGHCKCFGEMRYGHPGLEEHLADDGKWFDSHPEVRRWNVRSVQGDAVACNAADFGDDPFPQIENLKFCQCNLPEDAVWKPCAKGGEVCDCRSPESRERRERHPSLVRATDSSGAYYGAQAVSAPFTCPNDYPGASCECLGTPKESEMKWDWCANEGGKCPCSTRARFGHTGTKEMYDSGYFDEREDVMKWTEVEVLDPADGMLHCDVDTFGGVDPFPDAPQKICQCMMPVQKREETVLSWKWCAEDGGECECSSAARYGATGFPEQHTAEWFAAHPEVTRWSYRGDAPGTISCSASSFGSDPFPGQKKICQCLVERPRALDPAERVKRAIGLESPNLGETEWSWCGGDGTRCTCEGLVRYGSTGDASMYADGSKWFKDHPEVMKWTYLKSYGELECSQRTFGFDPFPDQKKICQCLQGYDEQFPYQMFRPEAPSLGAAMLGASQTLGETDPALETKRRPRAHGFVAQVIDAEINSVAGGEAVEAVEAVEATEATEATEAIEATEASASERVEPRDSVTSSSSDAEGALAASTVVRSVIGDADNVDVEEVNAMKLEMKRAVAESADALNQARLDDRVVLTSVALGSPRADGGGGDVSPAAVGAVVGIAAAAAVAVAGASRRGKETETGDAERVPLVGGQDAV